MSLLSALIQKREARKAATANPAISATQANGAAETVARIATVAIAAPPKPIPAPQANASAGDMAITSRNSCVSGDAAVDLENCVREMAKRWDYADDELAQALTLAAADPEGWWRLVAHESPASQAEVFTARSTGRCADCRHYQRTTHPHLGHCAKGEPEAIAGLWDTTPRLCNASQGNEV